MGIKGKKMHIYMFSLMGSNVDVECIVWTDTNIKQMIQLPFVCIWYIFIYFNVV